MLAGSAAVMPSSETDGMGDAVRDGDVHAADPEDTIDGEAPRPAAAAPSLPVEIVAATRDYKELLAVERHHYAITREIARGGVGRVFEARDLRIGRQVAIKELLPKNRDAARRFEREARITARLQHPAIIHVYEAGIWPGGEPFYAMPLVSGVSLDRVVAEKKSLNERLGLLPNVIAVADALAYAHNANVIHRDLKPANVLVGEYGETVVIDWGLAKDMGAHSDPKESLQMQLRATAEETMSGCVVGTPAYMPPEQARGDAVDQRADVYSLGALLYKVLAGAPPYRGSTSQEVLEQVKAGPPVPVQDREPGAPPDLVAIVAKAMARNADDRYITASELAQDLKRFETGQLVAAHRYTVGELVRRWLRRHRVAVSVATAALAGLIAIGVFSVKRVLDETQRANSERDNAKLRRANLLEERGRAELLAGHAGAALAYLVGSLEDGTPGGGRGFLIADAMRPFEAEVAHITVGASSVAVAASSDGSRIATAGAGAIEVRTAAGELVRSFGTHGITRVIGFDANGTRLVAAGDDGVARVWSLDGALVAELRGHDGAILDARFSRDGRELVTTGVDTTVRFWDLASRRMTLVPCHNAAVVSARFSPRGDKVLTASADATACLITRNTERGEPWMIERPIKGHTAAVNSAEWSPDGALLITASNDSTARVWSADRGKPVVAPLRHEPGSIVSIALISSDGVIATGGSDWVVRLWELPLVVPADGATPPPIKPPRRLVGHAAQIVTAGFSGDESLLVTGGLDGLAKIWDLRSAQAIATFDHGDAVTSAAFIPGAVRVATGSRDGAARIWNTTVAERHVNLDSAIHAIAIAPDGTVAAATDDSLVRLIRGDRTVELHGHIGSVLAVAFTPDGTRLISAGEDADAIVWDVASGQQLRVFGAHEKPTRALAVLPRSEKVVMLVAGTLEVWSLSTGTFVARLAAPGSIDAFAVNSVTGAIAAVGQDGTFVVWDGRGRLTTRPGGAAFTAVAYAPDGSALVTAGRGAASVWNVSDDVVGTAEAKLDGGTGEVRSVVVTRELVVTAGNDGTAIVWDRDKGKQLGTRDRHERPITSLALRGSTLWIASEDRTLNAWDVRIEMSPVPVLQQFMTAKHVPVELQSDDVVRKRTR
jgi:WD40 repeat protein/tRNA A-37 threonylcarbamoyl transferase component Bud32